MEMKLVYMAVGILIGIGLSIVAICRIDLIDKSDTEAHADQLAAQAEHDSMWAGFRKSKT